MFENSTRSLTLVVFINRAHRVRSEASRKSPPPTHCVQAESVHCLDGLLVSGVFLSLVCSLLVSEIGDGKSSLTKRFPQVPASWSWARAWSSSSWSSGVFVVEIGEWDRQEHTRDKKKQTNSTREIRQDGHKNREKLPQRQDKKRQERRQERTGRATTKSTSTKLHKITH